eukprot:jgi/Galph1/5453/GphlegSOOS_G4053.1
MSTPLPETAWKTPTSERKRRLSNYFRDSPIPKYSPKTPETKNTKRTPETPLHFNDDEAEKERLRREKRQQRLLENYDEAGSSMETYPQLDPQQLAQLYSTTIKLCADNKINTKNSWSLALIDHLRSLVVSGELKVEERKKDRETQHDEETNFQVAGVTLDASTKIYSYRVDSVHTSAYNVLGDLTRSGNQIEDDESALAGEDDHVHSTAKKKKGKARSQGECTLEKNLENISVKSFETESMMDPFLQMLSQSINSGETSNLLLRALSLSQEPSKEGACYLVLDSQHSFFSNQSTYPLVVDRQRYHSCVKFVNDWLQNNLPARSIADAYKKSICPDLEQFFHTLPNVKDDKENQLQSCTGIVRPSVEDPEQNRDTLEEETVPIDYTSFHLDTDDFSDSYNAFASEERFRGSLSGNFPLQEQKWDISKMDESERQQWVAELFARGADTFQVGEFLTNKSEQNVTWSHQNIDDLLAVAWAGPTHWKYLGGSKKLTSSENEKVEEKKIGKRHRSKVDRLLDFEKQVDDIDFSTAFSQPKNPNAIVFSSSFWSKTPEVANLLPPDLHYEPSDLFKFFLRPGYLIQRMNGENKHIHHDMNWDHMEAFDNFQYEIQDSQESYFGSVGLDASCTLETQVSSGEELGFVEQPYRVEKMEIPFATVAKNVDIRHLKQRLWKHLSENLEKHSSLMQEKDANVSGDSVNVSLQHLVETLSMEIDEKEWKEITPSYIFICLLHLANEKGLILKDTEDLSDIQIATLMDK